METIVIPFRRRGKSKPLIGVLPVYKNPGNRIVDYELCRVDGGSMAITPFADNMGLSVISTNSITRFLPTEKRRMSICFALCKNKVYIDTNIVWIQLGILRNKSSLDVNILNHINVHLSNPVSYTKG